ncbi:MAG: LysE family translocator [Caloramator sp.]|nr:LysE family translocator [Caloramator sp.]
MQHILKFIITIVTGFITGIFFALPLGPAGLESIKQTLKNGIKEGINVALGAVSADALDLIFINVGLFNLFNDNRKLEAMFFIICGLLIIVFAILDFNKVKNDNFIKKYDSMPFLKGFFLAFFNPMTHSFWITVSGTIIHRFSDNGILVYYSFLVFLILGMAAWFVFLNILALKGFRKFIEGNDNKTEMAMAFVMLIIGIGFLIYGGLEIIKFM